VFLTHCLGGDGKLVHVRNGDAKQKTNLKRKEKKWPRIL
jgi:hypothetical protein